MSPKPRPNKWSAALSEAHKRVPVSWHAALDIIQNLFKKRRLSPETWALRNRLSTLYGTNVVVHLDYCGGIIHRKAFIGGLDRSRGQEFHFETSRSDLPGINPFSAKWNQLQLATISAACKEISMGKPSTPPGSIKEGLLTLLGSFNEESSLIYEEFDALNHLNIFHLSSNGSSSCLLSGKIDSQVTDEIYNEHNALLLQAIGAFPKKDEEVALRLSQSKLFSSDIYKPLGQAVVLEAPILRGTKFICRLHVVENHDVKTCIAYNDSASEARLSVLANYLQITGKISIPPEKIRFTKEAINALFGNSPVYLLFPNEGPLHQNSINVFEVHSGNSVDYVGKDYEDIMKHAIRDTLENLVLPNASGNESDISAWGSLVAGKEANRLAKQKIKANQTAKTGGSLEWKESKPQAHPKSNTQPHTEPKPQAQPNSNTRPKAQPKSDTQPKAQPLPQAQPKPQAQPLPQAQPKPQAQPLPQAQPKPQAQPLPQAQPKPQAQPLPQAQPKSNTQPKAQPQPMRQTHAKTNEGQADKLEDYKLEYVSKPVADGNHCVEVYVVCNNERRYLTFAIDDNYIDARAFAEKKSAARVKMLQSHNVGIKDLPVRPRYFVDPSKDLSKTIDIRLFTSKPVKKPLTILERIQSFLRR